MKIYPSISIYYGILWNTSKAVFRGEAIVLNTCFNECEGIILSELNSQISEETNIK